MRFTILTVCFVAFFYAIVVNAAEPLSDAQMDDITAGSASIPIQIDQLTARGTHIVVDGDIQWQATTQNYNLVLSDYAQQNLNSLININAVNSPVNVLLNLNINIDSVVDEIQQFNLNGTLPSQ